MMVSSAERPLVFEGAEMLIEKWCAPEVETPVEVGRIAPGDGVNVTLGVTLNTEEAPRGGVSVAIAVLNIVVTDDIHRIDKVIYRHALDSSGQVRRSAWFEYTNWRGDKVQARADEIRPGDARGEAIERALLRASREELTEAALSVLESAGGEYWLAYCQRRRQQQAGARRLPGMSWMKRAMGRILRGRSK